MKFKRMPAGGGNERGEDYLYSGARLATAQERLELGKIYLGGHAVEFIRAGIDRQKALTQAERERSQAEQQRLLEAAEKRRAGEQNAPKNNDWPPDVFGAGLPDWRWLLWQQSCWVSGQASLTIRRFLRLPQLPLPRAALKIRRQPLPMH